MASLASLIRAAPVGNGGASAATPFALSAGADARAGIGTGGTGNSVAPSPTTAPVVSPLAGISPNVTVPLSNQLVGQQWYQQLLSDDPQLAAALQAISSQNSAYEGQAQTAEQQLLEQYGQIPSSVLGQYASILNPTVEDLANQNTAAGTSTYAQLTKAFHDSQTASLDSLGARGLLRSGATGQEENNNLQNYNTAQYSALQTLLGGLGTDQSNLLAQQGTLNQQSEQATNDAYQRILSQIQAGTLVAPSIGSGPSAPPTAPAPPAKPAAPAAPSVPYSVKPPTNPVVGSPGNYALAPGVGGRSGIGVGGALNS